MARTVALRIDLGAAANSESPRRLVGRSRAPSAVTVTVTVPVPVLPTVVRSKIVEGVGRGRSRGAEQAGAEAEAGRRGRGRAKVVVMVAAATTEGRRRGRRSEAIATGMSERRSRRSSVLVICEGKRDVSEKGQKNDGELRRTLALPAFLLVVLIGRRRGLRVRLPPHLPSVMLASLEAASSFSESAVGGVAVVTMLSSSVSSERFAERFVQKAVDGANERGIGFERLLDRVEKLLLLLGVGVGSGRLLGKYDGEAASLEALAFLCGESVPELGDLHIRRERDLILVLVGVDESGGGDGQVEPLLNGDGEGLKGGGRSGGEGEKTRSGVQVELERVGGHLSEMRRVRGRTGKGERWKGLRWSVVKEGERANELQRLLESMPRLRHSSAEAELRAALGES